MRITKFALLTVFLSYYGTSLRASVLVAGTDPAPGSFFDVSGASSDLGFFSLEQLFTISSPATLTSLSINAGSDDAETLELQLFSGLGLEGTGTLLDTLNVNVPAGSYASPTTLTQSVSVPLAAGDYSLVLSAGSSTGIIDFTLADDTNTPDGSLGGTHDTSPESGPYNIGFELDGSLGSPVPEPASAWLFICAILVGAGGCFRTASTSYVSR